MIPFGALQRDVHCGDSGKVEFHQGNVEADVAWCAAAAAPSGHLDANVVPVIEYPLLVSLEIFSLDVGQVAVVLFVNGYIAARGPLLIVRK